MVLEISPNYYAQGVRTADFVLTGENFDEIPANALGVYSSDNDDPLQHRYDREANRVFRIAEQSETSLTLTPQASSIPSVPVYLGAIVSQDGATVYWINNSKPLP